MTLYLAPWLGTEGQKAFWRQIAQMDDKYSQEVESSYGEIRCPVTILWEADDEWIPLKDGRELARRVLTSMSFPTRNIWCRPAMPKTPPAKLKPMDSR
jgi:pimeloyl-ACP methyl ester carboxylesterase